MIAPLLRIHQLGTLILTALCEGNYYRCYVLMMERTHALNELSPNLALDRDDLVSIQKQTVVIECSIQEKAKEIQGALAREAQTANARLSYAKNSIT